MKSYSVLMTHIATDDLKGIAAYIANELREPATAKKLVSKLREEVMSLAELPTRQALVADETLAIQGIRKLLIDNYVVFYVVTEKETVTIVRILNSRRDWVSLLLEEVSEPT
jgi:toxin ParE1/3/4